MEEPLWLSRYEVDYLHELLVAQFGGLQGVRDAKLLDSALARPWRRWDYEPDADLASLAASYGYGLTQNHGYVDGNKRIGFMAMSTFLYINDHLLDVPEPEAVLVMLEVAAGERNEESLAAWVRERIVPLPPPEEEDTA